MAEVMVSGADAPTTTRRLLKSIAAVVATIVTLPVTAVCLLGMRLLPGRADSVFQGSSQFMSLIPGFTGIYCRRAFYRLTLRSCASDVTIGFGTLFATAAVDLGSGVYIGTYCSIGHATIEADVLLGSNVTILSGRRQHFIDRLDVPIRHQGGEYSRVRLGRDSWLGNGSIVSCDVGTQAVVAAGAVVVRPVPDRAIVGGNPARPIGERGAADGTTSGEPDHGLSRGPERVG